MDRQVNRPRFIKADFVNYQCAQIFLSTTATTDGTAKDYFLLVKEEKDSIHGHLENYEEALENRSQETTDVHTSIDD